MFETAADLAREQAVAKQLRAAWSCRSEKLPLPNDASKHQIDLRIYRDGVDIYTEIKTRTCAHYQYPTYIISQKKVRKAIEYPRSILVVKWTDRIMWCDFRTPPAAECMGGREDRGAANDREMMTHFHLGKFQALNINPFLLGKLP